VDVLVNVTVDGTVRFDAVHVNDATGVGASGADFEHPIKKEIKKNDKHHKSALLLILVSMLVGFGDVFQPQWKTSL
jgi:hypothetical protein